MTLTLPDKVTKFRWKATDFLVKAVNHTAWAMVNQSLKITKGDKVLVWFDEAGLPLVHKMDEECARIGVEVKYFLRDLDKDAKITPTLDNEGIDRYFDEQEALVKWADKILIVRAPRDPEVMNSVAKDKKERYTTRYSQVHSRRISHEVDWCLFYWPIEYEAKKERMGYGAYCNLVFKACDQPWEQIEKAQERLIGRLDRGKKLRLVANSHDADPRRRTEVEMSIEGMTFVNSTIESNYPGSEVFSAPVKESVEGQIFAQGEYSYEGTIMRDILLKIKKGKIVEAEAKEGNEELQTILARGEGARYFGEVALGTNPGLKKRLFNALLNEKVSGSFHMAIGHCYTFTQEKGKPVTVNNGNTKELTSNHWDLTILMSKEAGGGRVEVDGELIQKDGLFVAPELEVLNG